MYRRLTQVLCGLVALVVLTPKPGLAFSLLWETQGSYVHQMAHLPFAIAMMSLFMKSTGENSGRCRGSPA